MTKSRSPVEVRLTVPTALMTLVAGEVDSVIRCENDLRCLDGGIGSIVDRDARGRGDDVGLILSAILQIGIGGDLASAFSARMLRHSSHPDRSPLSTIAELP